MRILVQTKTVGEEGRETSEEKINRAEQRKYPRYRYIHEIEICGEDGTEYSATSFEISEGDVCSDAELFRWGESVELYP